MITIPLSKSGMLSRAALSIYIFLLLVFPLATLLITVIREIGPLQMVRWATEPQALAAVKLTLVLGVVVSVLNGVAGTLIGWMIAKPYFIGKRVLNTLIDLPFAVPTVVTGMILVWFYGPQGVLKGIISSLEISLLFAKPGMILALLFVTFPLTIRSVQALAIEMDQDMVEAALSLGAKPSTVFWRICMPQIRPGILTGMALTFARVMGEFGSIIIIAGNIPFKTQVASVYIFGEIESGRYEAAVSVASLMLLVSLVILVVINRLDKWGR